MIAGETEVLGENLPQRRFVPPQIPHDHVCNLIKFIYTYLQSSGNFMNNRSNIRVSKKTLFHGGC
jgi:hypothetical protein